MIMINRIRQIVSMMMVSAVALLAVTSLAIAGNSDQSGAKSKRVAKSEKSSAATQAQKPAAVALVTPPAAAPKEHHLILQARLLRKPGQTDYDAVTREYRPGQFESSTRLEILDPSLKPE